MTALTFTLGPAVTEALGAGRPVVALESTIVTHGMPYPENVETALGVESAVREEGAVPATIAVLDGRLVVGLEPDEIEGLARAEQVMKLSRADLAYAVAFGQTGSTTVAATMIAAARAGIAVFATGGIGGVHRGAGESFDVSADLDELARTSVIVVSAGAKAILDIPKTLEVLETKGVPVLAYGTDRFPAFWSRDSGCPSPLRADDAKEIADFQRARAALGLEGGILVANPIEAAEEIARDTVEAWIAQALRKATDDGVAGKAVTPFLLEKMLKSSDGRSLRANIALVRSNARLAARIAAALTT